MPVDMTGNENMITHKYRAIWRSVQVKKGFPLYQHYEILESSIYIQS